MKGLRRLPAGLAAVLLALSFGLQACVFGPRLKVEPGGQVQNKTIRYDLILYGDRYYEDLHTVAILGIEGSHYKIVPYAPKFEYTVVRNVGGARAMETAVRFFEDTNPNFTGTMLSRILGPDGDVIGYEIKPLYQPFVYGMSDILDTSYWLKGKGTVLAWIRLKASINRGGGGQESDRPEGMGK